jgi:hypothetical protein
MNKSRQALGLGLGLGTRAIHAGQAPGFESMGERCLDRKVPPVRR